MEVAAIPRHASSVLSAAHAGAGTLAVDQDRFLLAAPSDGIRDSNRAPPAATPTAPTARKPPVDRQDSTDHRDWAENSDPVLSHDPVEISDRAEPIEPTDRALPIEPMDRAEPTDPTDSTDPTEPIDNTES